MYRNGRYDILCRIPISKRLFKKTYKEGSLFSLDFKLFNTANAQLFLALFLTKDVLPWYFLIDSNLL